MIRLMSIMVLLLLWSAAGCQRSKVATNTSAIEEQRHLKKESDVVKLGSQISAEQSRSLAAHAADRMIAGEDGVLLEMMDAEFREGKSVAQFSKALESMYALYGKPVEKDWKRYEIGKKWSVRDWYPLHTHWYAVQTSKHAKGSYFLIVQIVKLNEKLFVSSMQIVTFPLGKIPEGLK